MQLREITNGSVVIELDPGICLAIAEACHAVGDSALEENLTHHGGTFATLRCAFECLALVGAARGYSAKLELSAWSLATVREAWSFLPDPQAGRGVAE